MNKTQVIDTFNQHFIEFLVDVERVFPENKDITLAKKTINKSNAVLPKLLLKFFHEYFVKVYSNEIDVGDLDFFVTNDYREKHGYKPDDEAWVLNKIDCLREPIKCMNADDKAKVVKYIQNLKKLALLYYQLKQNNQNA
jgi:hypothetical protein